MTNKEQIIINGINVSGCPFLDEWKHCTLCKELSKTLDDIEEICRQLLDDDYIRSVAKNLIDIIDKAKEGNNE